MRLPRRAMPEDEFWEVVAVLGGASDEDAVERLVEVLRRGGKRRAVAFQERLAAVLFELDREVLCLQPVRWADDPQDAEPMPLSDDSFLYLRADIVARGKQVVEQVLADPEELGRRVWNDGEALLYAAEEAAGDEIETKVSCESGSNAEHWTRTELDPTTQRTPIVAVLLLDLLSVIEAYQDEAMTIPMDPPMFAWPFWFPSEVLAAVADSVDAEVRAGGGLPEASGVAQVRVLVGLGDVWDLTPDVAWRVEDDTGRGQVTQVRVALRQQDVRAWTRPEQQAALHAVVARAVLAALPPDHAGRPALAEAAAAGAHLLASGS